MRRMECTVCGLAPCDLPDGIDPEAVFERVRGQWFCEADAPETTAALTPLGTIAGPETVRDRREG